MYLDYDSAPDSNQDIKDIEEMHRSIGQNIRDPMKLRLDLAPFTSQIAKENNQFGSNGIIIQT